MQASTKPQIIVPVEMSVHQEFLICLFDGKKTKLLHRYVKQKYGMEWEEYLAYCGLPDDYPRYPKGYAQSKLLYQSGRHPVGVTRGGALASLFQFSVGL